MQLGFVTGGFGLIGRDLLFYLKVQNWKNLFLSELFFTSFVFLGFVFQTIGLAKLGVILSCLASVGSATALIFISIYSSMFLLFSNLESFYVIDKTTTSILGLSNIIGSLLVLGLPMGMYSLFLEQERNRSEKLLHNIMPKSITDQLKKDSKLISMDNRDISALFAYIVSFTVMSEKISSNKLVGFLNDMFSKFDVWGDTINTAARLVSYGSPDCFHMTKATYELLKHKEKKIERKSIQIRGKGLMDTILVKVE